MNNICKKYINEGFDENGVLDSISFKNTDQFNFAYDVLDAAAEEVPDKMCLWYVDQETRKEKKFTFRDMKVMSDKTANYFTSLGDRKSTRLNSSH